LFDLFIFFSVNFYTTLLFFKDTDTFCMVRNKSVEYVELSASYA